jgi:purine-binding chemotaxis protein CheW
MGLAGGGADAGSAESPRDAFLICRTGARFCGLPVGLVIETMRPLPVEPLAGMPSFVRGLSVIRGIPTPVVDAGALLATRENPGATRFVTVRAGERQVALAFEAVLGVRSLSAALLKDLPPLFRGAGAELVSAVGTLDAELLIVLRSARILSEEDWRTLGSRETAT